MYNVIPIYEKVCVEDARSFLSAQTDIYMKNKSTILAQKSSFKDPVSVSLGHPKNKNELIELESRTFESYQDKLNTLETLVEGLKQRWEPCFDEFAGKLELSTSWICNILNTMLIIGDSFLPTTDIVHDDKKTLDTLVEDWIQNRERPPFNQIPIQYKPIKDKIKYPELELQKLLFPRIVEKYKGVVLHIGVDTAIHHTLIEARKNAVAIIISESELMEARVNAQVIEVRQAEDQRFQIWKDRVEIIKSMYV